MFKLNYLELGKSNDGLLMYAKNYLAMNKF